MDDETRRMDRSWSDRARKDEDATPTDELDLPYHGPSTAPSTTAGGNSGSGASAASNDAQTHAYDFGPGASPASNDAQTRAYDFGPDSGAASNDAQTHAYDFGPDAGPGNEAQTRAYDLGDDARTGDAQTRAYDFGDDGRGAASGGSRVGPAASAGAAGDTPTQRFDTAPEAPRDRWVDAGDTRAFSKPYETTAPSPRSVPQQSRPTPSPQASPATPPAPMPAAAPIPPSAPIPAPAPMPRPAPPAAPYAGTPYAGAQAAARPVGPNGFARFGAILLTAMLVVPGLLLLTYGIVVALADTANDVAGVEAVGLPGIGLHLLFVFGGAVLLLLATMTARMSGLGAGVAGTVLVLGGLVALIWPAALGGWLVDQPWFPSTDGIEAVVTAVSSLTATVFGVLALTVGAMFVAIAGAVHGARRAGWDRGRGV